MRSRFAERASELIEKVWRRGWDEKPPLEPDYLWELGAKGFTADDEISIRSAEDVADFRLRLEKLCAALRDEAQLNALGHTMAYGQLKNAIRKRHALGRLWREEPGLAATQIAPPIIVLGQMRSGTTRMQRLLAADPHHAGTRFCDSHDPVPATPDLRPLKARAALFMARKVNPWLETLHPFGATRTDEEIGWLAAALSPASFEAQWRIPSFVAFSEQRDAAPVYREFARILRTDAAAHGNADKPRVLKCPQFAEDLPALLEQFPEARIVRCERAHDEVLASSVSMVASQMAFQSEMRDIEALEREWSRKLSLRERRMESALSAHPNPAATIAFDDLNSDWLGTITKAYRQLSLEFTAAANTAMEDELTRARGDSHAKHKNQMDEFAV
ncbi:sulfotransferase family protein [Qipengyuania sphaerica]|uniref:sulfotransferase family protein n=1 Tax=Qipengyuania sphaerica TaxID=2867243 RepID=UPI001C884AF1|nr:sulfotransferase [Qipengyuania sphaerica]